MNKLWKKKPMLRKFKPLEPNLNCRSNPRFSRIPWTELSHHYSTVPNDYAWGKRWQHLRKEGMERNEQFKNFKRALEISARGWIPKRILSSWNFSQKSPPIFLFFPMYISWFDEVKELPTSFLLGSDCRGSLLAPELWSTLLVYSCLTDEAGRPPSTPRCQRVVAVIWCSTINSPYFQNTWSVIPSRKDVLLCLPPPFFAVSVVHLLQASTSRGTISHL